MPVPVIVNDDFAGKAASAADHHPHPLRSHRSAENVSANGAKRKSNRPDPLILAPESARLHHDNRRSLGSVLSPRSSRASSFDDIPPVPPISPAALSPPPGLGHFTNVSPTSPTFPTIPVRPPLRPTVSFGGVSRYSYYSSSTSTLLDPKSIITIGDHTQIQPRPLTRQDWKTHSCLVSLCLLIFVCGMSTTACSVALPMISRSLGLTAIQSFWVPGSFLLLAALTQPLLMRLSLAIGCKTLLLFGLVCFTAGSIGSALSRHASSLLVSRCLEGVGCGAISVIAPLTLTQIVTAADRKRHERTLYTVFWTGCALGPFVGGAAAQNNVWRSIFCIQIIFGGFGLAAIPVFLGLPYISISPVWDRLVRTDFLGCILLAASVTSIIGAISWAGTSYPWTSWHTLVPLIVGVVSLAAWSAHNAYRYEAILPLSIFRTYSVAASCFGALVHGMLFTAIVYFVPLVLQITKNLDLALTGVALAPWTGILPVAGLAGGAIVARWGYRWAIWISWVFATASVGLLVILNEVSDTVFCIPIGLAGGTALGMLAPSLGCAIRSAASNDDETIHATPLHVFFTTLGQCFGVMLSSSIFLNQLHLRINANALIQDKQHYIVDAIAAIPAIVKMPVDDDALRLELVSSYLGALRCVWIAMCAISGVALFLSIWFTEDHAPDRARQQRRTSSHELA